MNSPFAPHGDSARLRTDLRRRFVDVARHLESGRPLDAADVHIAAVLIDHPEARRRLAGIAGEEAVLDEPALEGTESSFFLHLALHVALREQAAADLPPGVRRLHAAYVAWAGGDRVLAEHRMLPILEDALRRSLEQPGGDDPRAYLQALESGLERLRGERRR
jgi:hypothetical protein